MYVQKKRTIVLIELGGTTVLSSIIIYLNEASIFNIEKYYEASFLV